jgi:Na+:H+ antiporter, NhaC family
VLGVQTASYLPYCFFNLLSPILDVAYGYLGFKVPTATPEAESDRPAEDDRPAAPAPSA